MSITPDSWEAAMQAEDKALTPRSRKSGAPRKIRLMLRLREAAEALGMCEDSFTRHVAPEIAMVRRGKLRLVPIGELERWVHENPVQVRGGR